MLIDLFIDSGWHTVPLKGELRRLESGKKTLPIFESEWKKKYTANFNTKKVEIAGALTGAKSGIMAIDCDNQVTYDLFKQLDTDYNFHFISKDKPEGGGTIIYKYDSNIGGFKVNNDDIKLDFFSDEGFVYLPTEGNSTKESWLGMLKLPELKEAPAAIVAILKTFKSKFLDNGTVKTAVVKSAISNRLAPLLSTFIKNEQYDPALFRIITPYSFREIPTYVTRGHLHPKDVPKGRGSEYLMKVSAILGADISVNMELYTKSMMLINSLKSTPKEKSELLSTVINPMVEERSTIDGQVIWQYDKYWEKMGFIATSINGDYIESFFDDVKGMYYLINYSVPYVKVFNDKNSTISTLKALLGRAIPEIQFDTVKRLIRTKLNPSLEFGHIEGTDMYNLFRQTQELAVLNDPAPYRTNYNRPTTIISFFESLIPDDKVRMYVLSFLKTKLTTFNYSPVALYFLGKPGSGKDTFVNIIRKIIGDDYVSKPDTKVFTEQYNGWLMDKFFVHLDEYGNKLVRHSDKQETLGKIKAYTGSPDIQIRAMRQDGFNYKHCMTFILTANNNPLPVELDDRRFLFIQTPNKLELQDWVKELGGISLVQDRIREEILDFCYYLGTEIPALTADAYVISPMTKGKEKIMLDNMPAAEHISYYVNNSQYKLLFDLALEYDITEFDEGWEKNRLMSRKVTDLYKAMTEGSGSSHTIIKALKNIGLSRSHTTKNGLNDFYYFVNDLHKFKQTEQENHGFEPSPAATPVKEVKGLD